METLTVNDLLEMLQQQVAMGNGELAVHKSYTYGDHWATTVAPVASDAELLHVEYSGYHQQDKLTEDDGEEQTDNSKMVFVIS